MKTTDNSRADALTIRDGAENFACYLIDRCERETVTEENVQAWLGEMLREPQYAASPVEQHEAAPVRCGCCGYLVTDSEHRGCLRAAQPEPPVADERAAFDIALDALWKYQQDWDTGLPAEYAQGERIAMEGACEAVREALEEARASSPAVQVGERAALHECVRVLESCRLLCNWPDMNAAIGNAIAKARTSSPTVPTDERAAWADEIIDSLQASFDTEGITENDSGDALVRLSSAIAAVKEAANARASSPNAAGAEEPTIPAELHHDTAKLVRRFARALANKLLSAQRKYGYSDNWMRDDWADECRAELMRHVHKGDPRDVAAYCAFLWHHNESTAPAPASAPVGLTERQRAAIGSAINACIKTGWTDPARELRALLEGDKHE
ncbi:hypothetical protein [Burkholderia vietnamiensis]|uniref:hypothetical protein n=1 Tax=Burkholderia vietnamiensis TaxID=60552 RepID=UPI001F3486EF|nr:hypothetical protein [Burkholderia vietnamiensis]